MNSTVIGNYFYSYDSNGVLECVNAVSSGATVWVKDSPQYTEANPLTAEFLATNPDLSDKPDMAEGNNA